MDRDNCFIKTITLLLLIILNMILLEQVTGATILLNQ